MAKWERSMSIMVVVVLSLCFVALGKEVANANIQAFYFIQQWLGSYCNQKGTTCCYPPTEKPAQDFTVYGLWPYTNDNTFPTNCDGPSFDVDPLKPLQDGLQVAWPSCTCPQIGRKFWLHEWNKRGTCSKPIFSEIQYLQTAINFKTKITLLQALSKAGIKPDNRSYPFTSIKQAVSSAFAVEPWIMCNTNAQGNHQIWQITVCFDNTGSSLIKCPSIPQSICGTNVQFSSF